MHKCDMIMDFQFGSTGKGLLAGWLAKRGDYDTAVCSFATNAGHTYIDKERGIEIMTQQLPTAITSPTVKNVLIGPGALVHVHTLLKEIARYGKFLVGKRLVIHPHAAIVEDYHAEKEAAMTKIGSTAKGVGAAAIERILRNPHTANVAKMKVSEHPELLKYVVTTREYDDIIGAAESIIVEGAQGFSLSMYHGFYPYTTSRDVTPWQIAADCGLPFKWASYIQIWGTLRTFPIRVNNRDGFSGPGYDDQVEVDWDVLGINAELTTVTKLPRRIFTFSRQQLEDAMFHCGGYWKTNLFLNFANYFPSNEEGNAMLRELVQLIQEPSARVPNAPHVVLLGWGPDDANVQPQDVESLLCKKDL